MNGKINNTLVAGLRPSTSPFEVNDADLKGFGLRVQPSGAMSFFVRYRLKGKQTRFVIGRTTEFTAAQARDTARGILAGVNLGKDPSEMRKAAAVQRAFGDFIDKDYTPWAMANRKSAAATIARIRFNFDAHWSRPINEITALMIEKWRVQRLTDPTKPAKPATVNRDLNALKAALSRAVDWSVLEVHPLATVKPSEVEQGGIVRYLEDVERERLFRAMDTRDRALRAKRRIANEWRRARGYVEIPEVSESDFADHLNPLVIVSLNTGLRQGELFSLEWSDVDFEKKQVTVRGESAKSGKTRHVPLNEDVLTALTRWKGQQSPCSLLVFAGPTGKRLVDIKTSWASLLISANVVRFRWHDMRHDFASRLVMLGVDLNTVRELLGHADLKMTLRYAHLAPQHKAAAVAKLVLGT